MQLMQYLSSVKAELSRVTWPTRQESYQLTLVIIIFSLVVGLYVGGLDLLFTNLLGFFVK